VTLCYIFIGLPVVSNYVVYRLDDGRLSRHTLFGALKIDRHTAMYIVFQFCFLFKNKTEINDCHIVDTYNSFIYANMIILYTIPYLQYNSLEFIRTTRRAIYRDCACDCLQDDTNDNIISRKRTEIEISSCTGKQT
jgi:hypothetical protein